MVMLREVPDDAEGLDQLKQVNAMHGATNRLIRAYPVVVDQVVAGAERGDPESVRLYFDLLRELRDQPDTDNRKR
jgi:hypothetical protein